ncbi:MAG: cysteine--tRNA ligase [Pseudomonadota bacterium]|nr:cysteine--tRNA ligase [Pseudomonadota bacterium]
MTLRIYNTLTRTKEVFTPIDPTNVRMYVCGPTVYDYAHIGNARPAIVFDVMFRLLRHIYGESHVTYVRNITDVDDKINARALRDYPGMELNTAIRAVTEKTYDQYQKDVAALGCLPPTAQPRATEHIQGMVDMIRVLINRGHAYEAGGEVLFDVMAMKDYGALSGRKQEDLLAGARIAVDAHKKNASDFVLWKQSAADEPGWDSPWGRGRPGWHIECSVMSKAHLGEVFDIHGGGLDLIFPHHENEIAQSRCANGTHGTDVMANYWMHNGFLQVEGQKMSKSLGNFYAIAELLETKKFGGLNWDGRVLRWAMLGTHYRQPIDWTFSKLQEASGQLLKFKAWDLAPSSDEVYPPVLEALADDLNLPKAYAELFALFNQVSSTTVVDSNAERRLRMFSGSLRLLGISDLADFASGADPELTQHDRVQAENLISARLNARSAKNWAESDRIRDELDAMGIAIKDNKDGTTTWEVKR